MQIQVNAEVQKVTLISSSASKNNTWLLKHHQNRHLAVSETQKQVHLTLLGFPFPLLGQLPLSTMSRHNRKTSHCVLLGGIQKDTFVKQTQQFQILCEVGGNACITSQ